MASCSDVFISFCWTDTRFSFISHLSTAFRRRGISTSINKDCTEPESDRLSEVTKDEIERSKVCVVVFSTNYIWSKLCLDTLVKIMKRKRNNSQAVIPVYYHLDKADVMQQMESLTGDCLELTKWEIKQRDALLDAVNLEERFESGLSDSDLVETIIADVRDKLDQKIVGIYLRLLKVENLLFKQPWGVRSVGIWGMSGIGKTTLARAAFDQLSEDYDGSCFVEDFHIAFETKGLYRLREEQLAKYFKEEININSCTADESLLWNKLGCKRILIILDDVRNSLNVEAFFGRLDRFRPGSTIIITSRDKQVLEQCRVNDIYEAQGLDEKEALQLFSRCAFGGDVTGDKDLLELSKEVIKYANRNPQALIYYGKALNGKDTAEMRTKFCELKRCPPDELFSAFRSSYDALIYNDKNIFLDIACFFRGEKLDRVIQLLEGCGFNPCVGMERLVEKCLITIVRIGKDNVVEMHNLIQDFGREIINRDTKEIERLRRLWDFSSIKSLLEDNQETTEILKGTEVIEGIFLDATDEIVVNPSAFHNMYNLRLLKIFSSKRERQPQIRLAEDLKSLPHELRFLHWECYPSEYLPQDFDIGHLVELNMPYSKLKKLWERSTENIMKLKTVILCHSQQLVEIGELNQARNLDRIDLQGCTELRSFPDTSHLEQLKVLNLFGCTEIKIFPEVPPNLRELCLKNTGIREIRCESVEKLCQLAELDLSDCKNLRNFPNNIYKMKSLEQLNLSGCSNLKSFPEISVRMKNLRNLNLSGTGIEELHASISNITGLELLQVENCRNLKKVPRCLKELRNLKVKHDGDYEASV